MTDTEKLDFILANMATKDDIKALSKKVDTLEIKLDVMDRKLEDITFRVASIEHNNRKEFAANNDQIETLIAVLEAHNILPKQA